MRIPSVIFGTVLAAGLAFAGHSEAVVYTAGNLTGISPRTNAVLDLSQDVAMKLRIGRTDVSVPFAAITSSAEGADAAVAGKKGRPFELLTVEFNSVQGDTRTMTLEMSQLSAAHVLATIHRHVPVAAAALQTPAAPEAPAQSASAAPAESPAPTPSSKPADKKADKKAQARQQAADAQKAKQDKKEQAKLAKQQKNDKKDKKDEVAKAKKDKANANKEVAENEMSTVKPATKKEPWWGDSVWKTNRNEPGWEQPAATPAAQ